jgi:hypothetical protein
MATKLSCGDSHIGATALAIYRYATSPPFFVELLDVSNPLKPSLACTLMPASGARILSATKLAFWTGDQLGIADLSSGNPIVQTARLAATAGTGAFTADGTKFAYRSHDDAGRMSLHLMVAGSDRTLYVSEPMGGHGGPGPSVGPTDNLQFSADGALLLDEFSFRPVSGPANFIVFKSDGSIAFQSKEAAGGTWSPVGHTLYFRVGNQAGPTGELHGLTADGRQHVIATSLDLLNWPRMSPDGSGIIYNATDSSVPDCGGVPHLWRVDLTTGHAVQISNAISSGPFFVQPTVVWSDEQVLSPCGPGGPSSEDGVILAHDMVTGRDATVDTTLLIPGSIGGSPLPPSATWNLLDTWFAR